MEKMNREKVRKIAEDAGWTDLGEQKMKVMMSFQKGETRMNVYVTTGSVTFQNIYKLRMSGENYRDVSMDEFRKLVIR